MRDRNRYEIKLIEIAENAAIKLEVIIANQYEVEWRLGGFFEKQSSKFLHAPYDAVKVCFNYDELRYIIVPGEQARLDTIKQIMVHQKRPLRFVRGLFY